MKRVFPTLLAVSALSVLAAGCSQQPRWQVQQVNWTPGTNFAQTYSVPLLLDTKSGRTWVLRNDVQSQKLFWLRIDDAQVQNASP
jgi:hypothetical protein